MSYTDVYYIYILSLTLYTPIYTYAGDVIYIEANSGSVKRVGRSDIYASEYDLEADEFVPVPKGNVYVYMYIYVMHVCILTLCMCACINIYLYTCILTQNVYSQLQFILCTYV